MAKLATFVSGLAMAAAIGAVVATPADAQRRNRGEAAAAAAPASGNPQVSRPFATAYQPVNTAVAASNWAAADAALPALAAAATIPYEKYLAAQMDFRIAVGLANASRQLAAVEAMIASTGAPAADLTRLYVAAGQLAYNADDYAKAATYTRQGIDAGSTTEGLATLELDALLRSGQLDKGLTTARAQIAAAKAAGGRAPDAIYGLVARALVEADRTAEFMEITVLRAGDYPTAANFRTAALAFLQNTPEDRGKTLDIMRLLTAADAMSDRRYYLEYVGNLVEDGLPNEALTSIAAGRAANLIPANDATFNEIEGSQRPKLAEDRSSLPGTEGRAMTNASSRLAMRAGDAYLSYDNFAKAEELYMVALTKSDADADLANTHIGIARVRGGNNAGALEAFAKVTGDRAPIARMWEALVRSRMQPAAAAPAAAPAAPTTN